MHCNVKLVSPVSSGLGYRPIAYSSAVSQPVDVQ